MSKARSVLTEHLNNSLEIASHKTGIDRAGWMEDAADYRAALAEINAIYDALADVVRWWEDDVNQGEPCPDAIATARRAIAKAEGAK